MRLSVRLFALGSLILLVGCGRSLTPHAEHRLPVAPHAMASSGPVEEGAAFHQLPVTSDEAQRFMRQVETYQRAHPGPIELVGFLGIAHRQHGALSQYFLQARYKGEDGRERGTWLTVSLDAGGKVVEMLDTYPMPKMVKYRVGQAEDLSGRADLRQEAIKRIPKLSQRNARITQIQAHPIQPKDLLKGRYYWLQISYSRWDRADDVVRAEARVDEQGKVLAVAPSLAHFSRMVPGK